MWEIARRIKRSMRNKPARFTRNEETAVVDWWRRQYDDKGQTWKAETEPKPPTLEETIGAIRSLSLLARWGSIGAGQIWRRGARTEAVGDGLKNMNGKTHTKKYEERDSSVNPKKIRI
ncbi:unnamed protein product [Blepharisma stoltei]|uniref:Uncharacterized protein n=1 Tax=Blepharisma stoltei TaxID=1481888 RepID=A0AAU9ILY3_9CILI|nr:unnamed protein product [Blepharisma stoltei]